MSFADTRHTRIFTLVDTGQPWWRFALSVCFLVNYEVPIICFISFAVLLWRILTVTAQDFITHHLLYSSVYCTKLSREFGILSSVKLVPWYVMREVRISRRAWREKAHQLRRNYRQGWSDRSWWQSWRADWSGRGVAAGRRALSPCGRPLGL